MNERDESLSSDIIDALNTAQRPDEAMDEVALQRLRSNLMKRIAADSVQHHVATSVSEGDWHVLLPGIDRKILQRSGEVMSYLLRFAPGAVLPAHRHPVDEECVVIQGQLRIGGTVDLGPGGFHMVRAGVLDADSTSELGCLIYLRGATPRSAQLV